MIFTSRNDVNDQKNALKENNFMVSAENIIDFPSLKSGGLSLRKKTKGSESDMVDEYVKSKIFLTETLQAKIVFLEPRIDSSFPDIVIVYLAPEIANKWSNKRASVNKFDLRILHYIVSQKTVDRSQMKVVFPNNFSNSLRRLIDAELIDYKEGLWEAKPLEEIFAIGRLIAIEAKMKNWQEGLQQAFHNTWFASESYLLLPDVPNTSDLTQQATSFGVGLLAASCSPVQSQLPAKVGQLPKSYASWLFNEWTWQALSTYVLK